MDKSEKTILLVLLVLLLLCCCLLVVCGGLALAIQGFTGIFSPAEGVPQVTVVAPVLTEVLPTQVPTSTSTPVPQGGSGQPLDTLSTLQDTVIPNADFIYLAERYEGKKGIPLQLFTAPTSYEVGDKLDFSKINTDTNETSRITAVLRYASDTLYFWVEDGVYIDRDELEEMLEVFETEIYPTNQEFFGTEWIPGVDNDPHLFVLYAGNLGRFLAGYNSSSDTVLPLAHENSNAHEMFYL